MLKVKPSELLLGDKLVDGAQVVGRKGNGALVLARPTLEAGWAREERYVFGWPGGEEKEVYLASRAPACTVCGHGTVQKDGGHEVCIPGDGPDLAGAVEALLGLGGQLIEPVAVGKLGPWHPALGSVEFTVFDLETTGLHRVEDRIIELGAIRVSVNGEIRRMESLVNPGFPIPARSTEITGITDEDVAGAPREREVIAEFAEFCRGSILVAHNIEFDAAFVQKASERHDIEVEVVKLLDTLELARGKPGGASGLIPRADVLNYKLTTLTQTLGIRHPNAHRAMSDVEGTVGLLDHLLKKKYRQQQER